MEYTVTIMGVVRDPFAVDCRPKSIFERASMKAAEQFKYSPRVKDGIPVEFSSVQNKFEFELEN